MIASYEHRFIFVKTRKTSGTSAEIIMSSWCAGKDICTPISPEDEVQRRKLGGRAMNYRRWFLPAFTGHMSALAISGKLPDLWAVAHKFTVDRHPYEKVISQAAYRLGKKGDYTKDEFMDYLGNIIEEGKFINYPLYMNGDVIVVDEIVKFPEFWKYIGDMAEKKNLFIPDKIPRAKSRFKKEFVTVAALSATQKNQIYEKAAPEFEVLSWDR